MEKINVAELLKDCPKGMELDCTICNGVKFIELDRNPNFPIVVRANNGYEFSLTKYGQVHNIDDAKCVIFPKGKTTWEGFVPPCKFKDGDIIFDSYLDTICIFRGEGSIKGTVDFYCGIGNSDILFIKDIKNQDGHFGEINEYNFATEEEKTKLFQAIKDNGYKWNEETKTLEKLIEPKFKVGDRIRRKNSNEEYTIISISDYTYYYRLNEHCTGSLGIQLQDDYELVPDKFDINTLKPFESRVLVRDNKLQKWSPAIWGFYDSDSKDYKYKLVGVVARYCIPYEGNQHLLGTTNDCDEFYKTWE